MSEEINKKYWLLVLGCQMNQSDAERIATVLEQAGFVAAENEASAGIIVVVACSVRQAAIDRVYGKAANWRRRRRHGQLRAILTGCVLPTDRDKFQDRFDLIFDIKEISQLENFLNQKQSDRRDYFALPAKNQSAFQAYVPIMTGCNNFCAYCVVPYTRGREVSRSAEEIIAECQKLINSGYKEITLLGQNVNSYQSGDYDFPKLLKTIDGLIGDFWLRFITSHPKDLSDELIFVMASGQHVAPYLHLAVQSGDNVILEKMNRRYTAEHYLKLVEKVKGAMPEIMLSTDVIVGFPGEGEEQFQNTVKLFAAVGFDMAYIAKYSPRLGTAAAKLIDNVSRSEKHRRWDILNELLKKTALANNQRFLNQTVRVLVEGVKGDGRLYGKTADFKTTVFDGEKSLIGKFTEVKITRIDSWGLFG